MCHVDGESECHTIAIGLVDMAIMHLNDDKAKQEQARKQGTQRGEKQITFLHIAEVYDAS